MPEVDAREIETLLVAATRSWGDDLEEALHEEHGEERGSALHRRYGDAFPTAYRADWVPRSALADIGRIETLPDDAVTLSLYRPLEAPLGQLRAKVYRAGAPLALSDILPLFESLGVNVADERPYAITPRDRNSVWLYDFGLTYPGEGDPETESVREAFQEAFIRAWGRGGRDRRLRPAGAPGSPGLARHRGAARRRPLPAAGGHDLQRPLRRAGPRRPRARGDPAGRALPRPLRPDRGRSRRADALVEQIEEEIDAVESLDHDRVLRNFLGVVCAMLRTNFFQRSPDGTPKPSTVVPSSTRPSCRGLAAARARASRSSSTRRASRASTCAAGRWRAAASAGPTAGRTSGRGPGSDEGADGQERGNRPGGRQGRLRGKAPASRRRPRGAAGRGRGLLPALHQRPARRDGQHRRGRDRAPGQRGAPRRGRSLPRRGGGQGHGHLLRHRQRDLPGVRLLARRRLRLRWLERVRPQEDGHHRAWRLGVGQAPFPRARTRRPEPGLHGRSASATCPATCSATACCCRPTSA